MSLSDDIKLIKDIERYLKSTKKFLDMYPDDQSICCQEMKKQYDKLAEELGRKYSQLSNKLR